MASPEGPLVTTLLIMTNPTKKVDANTDCADRELSWCLGSLHAFYREEGPEEGGIPLSWSLGTFPNYWIYPHFIFHYFSPCTPRDVDGFEKWKGSGIRHEGRMISAPIGWNGQTKRFAKER
ncbi:hypothetical protein ACO1O0_007545 [Amphichorda felina]